MHRVLYTVANSKAMNGAMPGSIFKDGMRATEKVALAVNVLGPVLIALMAFFTRSYKGRWWL